MSASACDCDEPRPPVDTLLIHSNNVFVGKLISAKIVEFKKDNRIIYYSESEFEVIESFKGNKTISIKLLNDISDCGQIYEKGKEYLLYSVVYRSTNSSHIHRCHSYCPEITEEEAISDLRSIRKIITKQK